MTFIASVIARDGVAIVADSLTTTIERSMDLNQFVDYINSKPKGQVDLREMVRLFKERPSYTRNYADKLIKLDDFTAISTAGQASLNSKPIKEIIENIGKKIASKNSPKKNTEALEQKVVDFCKELRKEAVSQIRKIEYIDRCVFIFSHFCKTEDKAKVIKVELKSTSLSEIKSDPKHKFIDWADETEYRVISDGQDRIIDRLLFGSLYRNATYLTFKVAGAVFKELNCRKATRERVTKALFDKNREHLLREDIKNDVNLVSLRPLSLQEAVDFAALLMRIIKDLQLYTEKTPTVGGLIKLAIISKENGFEDLHGHNIIAPNIID